MHTSGLATQTAICSVLTQCPSSVANTSFPSLIFPETWLTLSLLPRNGCRTDGGEGRRSRKGGKTRKGIGKGKEEGKTDSPTDTVYKLQLKISVVLLHSCVGRLYCLASTDGAKDNRGSLNKLYTLSATRGRPIKTKAKVEVAGDHGRCCLHCKKLTLKT